MNGDLPYKIGITLIPNVGDIIAKTLISYCGSVEQVFKEKKKNLLKIPGIGETIADAVVKNKVLGRAEDEIKFITKYNIQPLFYLDKEYPLRLKQCIDAPVMLYLKGNVNLNPERAIAVVGTRNATSYGKTICEELVTGLKNSGALIVSGLAFGIDITSHRAALDNGLPTVGVIAHGLDTLYPPEHYSIAKKMLDNGGLVTDFISGVLPGKENFPKRNRIIAGLADAVVIVESKVKGGAMITADIAFSYSREVLAFPGRTVDEYSQGCNRLIQQNKGYLIRTADDAIEYLGWKDKTSPKVSSPVIFPDLSREEETIVNVLKSYNEPVHIDDIAIQSKLTPGNLSAYLLNLEFSGVLKSLPGKMYTLCLLILFSLFFYSCYNNGISSQGKTNKTSELELLLGNGKYLFRNIHLASSPAEVMKSEPFVPEEKDSEYISYSLPLDTGKLNYNDTLNYFTIDYNFDKNKLYEIDEDIYIRSDSGASSLYSNIKEYFTSKYGDGVNNMDGLLWTVNENDLKVKISLTDESEEYDYGKISLVLYDESL